MGQEKKVCNVCASPLNNQLSSLPSSAPDKRNSGNTSAKLHTHIGVRLYEYTWDKQNEDTQQQGSQKLDRESLSHEYT